MASGQVRFRCFRCNQLLAVKASRAGSTVACPKCAIELIVPESEPEPTPPSEIPVPSTTAATETAADPLRSFLASITGDGAGSPTAPSDDIAPDFPEFGPAGIRVEPDVGLRPEPAGPPRVPRSRVKVESSPAPPEPPPPADIPAFEPDEEATGDSGLAIRVPEQAVRPEWVPTRTRDDVVMPRAAVTAWSLFAILALALAFIAGLLVGHHVWKMP